MSKIIKSCRFLPSLISKLGTLGIDMVKRTMTDLAIPLAKDVLPGLVSNMASNATSSVIDKLGRKINGKEAI